MGWKEWIIAWAKKKVLVHYAHHKDEVHRLTDIFTKELMRDATQEFLKKRNLTKLEEQLVLEAVTFVSTEVDARADAAFDKWVADQLGGQQP